MIPWADIEGALFDWATAATGWTEDGQISFSFNNVGRAQSPFLVINIDGVQSVGIDDVVLVETEDDPPDLVEMIVGQRVISVSMNAFQVADRASPGPDAAREAIDKIRGSWELASTTALFDAANIGQLSTGPARDLTALDNGHFEHRWSTDFEFNAVCIVTDDGNVIGTIDSMSGEGRPLDKPIRSFTCP